MAPSMATPRLKDRNSLRQPTDSGVPMNTELVTGGLGPAGLQMSRLAATPPQFT